MIIKDKAKKGGNKQSDDAFVCCDDIQLCFNFVFWQSRQRRLFSKVTILLLTKHGWSSCGAELENLKFLKILRWSSKIGLGRRTWPKSISRWRLCTTRRLICILMRNKFDTWPKKFQLWNILGSENIFPSQKIGIIKIFLKKFPLWNRVKTTPYKNSYFRRVNTVFPLTVWLAEFVQTTRRRFCASRIDFWKPLIREYKMNEDNR